MGLKVWQLIFGVLFAAARKGLWISQEEVETELQRFQGTREMTINHLGEEFGQQVGHLSANPSMMTIKIHADLGCWIANQIPVYEEAITAARLLDMHLNDGGYLLNGYVTTTRDEDQQAYKVRLADWRGHDEVPVMQLEKTHVKPDEVFTAVHDSWF